MKRKLLALLLSFLLIFSLALGASADAYIPPEQGEGFDMNYAYMENGKCKALNTFLSNFAEVGIWEFAADTPDDALIAAVLKHIELNADYYSANVSQFTGEDGKPYMRIVGSFFEQRMAYLFGRNISASDCPGYQDGYIEVTADHFGGPIQVFASVYACFPMGINVYEVRFDVLRIDRDFSGWYTTAYPNLPWDNLTTLGSGSAIIQYAGDKYYDTISSSDFSLLELKMEVEDLPCRGANVPFGYVEPTQPPETQAPTEPQTEPATEEVTEAPTESPVRPQQEKEDLGEDEDEPEKSAEDGIDIGLVLVIILVGAVVLLALILLFFLVLTKKKP